ncbi:glycoside hydrolase family 172 protein [Murimonas intestini]|uniref:glycoside hydrolase family 172 protein n=1 Tax=Murimonas intestini TaxID=1337051 RepID=UPI0011DD36CB|nr:glycoside hydrolase family 172 protein [Murimonas intestini]
MENYTYEQLLEKMTDLRGLAIAPKKGEQGGCFSSFDRRSRYDGRKDRYIDWGANEDGAGCISEEKGSYVVFDKKGPGVIWRVWSAMPGKGHIRIFIDDRREPEIDMEFRDFFEKYCDEPMPANYPGMMMTLSRGKNRFIPIPFQKRCRILLNKGWGMYYHFTYSVFPKETMLPSFDMQLMRDMRIPLAVTDRQLSSKGKYPYRMDKGERVQELKLRINPGERWKGREKVPGALTCLAVKTLPGGTDLLQLFRQTGLSIYWDREEEPSIECRLGNFYASPGGASEFRSYPVMVGPEEAAAYWYMPYRMFDIALKNNGSEPLIFKLILVQRDEEPEWIDSAMRFCCKTHTGDGTEELKKAGLPYTRFQPGGDRWPDWPVLLAKGTGRFCGMNLMVENTWKAPAEQAKSWWWGEMDEKTVDWWWGEGDEKFFVDGEKFPSTFGTGSEDYVGYAWAAEPPHAAFDSPYAVQNEVPIDGNGITSVSRFHICDNIPFQNEFQGFIEKYKGERWDERLDGVCRYECTSYYYLKDRKNGEK